MRVRGVSYNTQNKQQ